MTTPRVAVLLDPDGALDEPVSALLLPLLKPVVPLVHARCQVEVDHRPVEELVAPPDPSLHETVGLEYVRRVGDEPSNIVEEVGVAEVREEPSLELL